MKKKLMVLAGSLLALAMPPAFAKPVPQSSTPPTNGVLLPSGSETSVQPRSAPPNRSLLLPNGPIMRPNTKLGNQDALREALRQPGSCRADLSVERVEASKPQNGQIYTVKVVVKNVGTEAVVGGPFEDGSAIQVYLQVRQYPSPMTYNKAIGEITRLEAGASIEFTNDMHARDLEGKPGFIDALVTRWQSGPVCAYDNNADNDRLGFVMAAFMYPFDQGQLRSVLVRR